jgi:hypothetical protein
MAIGAAVLTLPAAAEARSGPQQVAQKLERIAYATNRVPEIRGLRRQDTEIDRLQSRLHRLDRISDRQRGRLARRNEATIKRLQNRLRRMERRVEAKIARRGEDRYGRRDWRRDGRRDDGRDGRRSSDRGYSEPTVVFGGNAWRY